MFYNDKSFTKLKELIDVNLVTPSDYCFLLRDLPERFEIKELDEYLKSKKIEGIQKILIPYRVKENKDEINLKINVL